MTLKQKPEGIERRSHIEVWEKSVPGRIAMAKTHRVEQNLFSGSSRTCFQGAARGLWAWSRVNKERVIGNEIRSTHAVMKGRSSFFLSAVYSIMKMYQSFLIHTFTDGYLGCFQHLAIVNYAAMNTGVHRFFWTGVSEFLGYNPSSGIADQKAVPFLVF